jgi:hypothetical protein
MRQTPGAYSLRCGDHGSPLVFSLYLSQGILFLSLSFPHRLFSSPDFVQTSLTILLGQAQPHRASIQTAPASPDELFQLLKEQTHSVCLTNRLLLANLRSQFKVSRTQCRLFARAWPFKLLTTNLFIALAVSNDNFSSSPHETKANNPLMNNEQEPEHLLSNYSHMSISLSRYCVV